jgi:hypothetical protein
MVEIAAQLEAITSSIEGQREREREARRQYRLVADEVEAGIQRIRAYAQDLVREQRRRMASFDGMLGPAGNGTRNGAIREVKPGEVPGRVTSGRLSIHDAILRVWTLEGRGVPLTTDQIARSLGEVGYTTRAAPRSIKSTLNQALARLCRDRKVRRFRTDGTEISPEDNHSRARKYLPA